jgi:hypothetical protein
LELQLVLLLELLTHDLDFLFEGLGVVDFVVVDSAQVIVFQLLHSLLVRRFASVSLARMIDALNCLLPPYDSDQHL